MSKNILGAAVVLGLLGASPAFAAPAIDASPASEGPSSDMLLHAKSGGLTAEAAVKRALESAPVAKVDEAKLDAAGAKVDEAWNGYLPRLSFTARYTRLSAVTPPTLGAGTVAAPADQQAKGVLPAGSPLVAVPLSFSFPTYQNQYTLQASLLVPLSDYVFRIYDANKAAAANQKATKLGAEVNRQQVATDARVAFYNWLRAKGSVVVADAAVKQAELHLKDLRQLQEVGAVTKADVGRVEASLAAALLAKTRTESLVRITEANLRMLVHAPEDEALIVGEDLGAELPPLGAELPRLRAAAFAKRPELLAIDAQVEGATATSSIATANMIPRLDLFANLQYQRPNSRIVPAVDEMRFTWDASVQLSWSPNDLLLGKTQKRAADANVGALKATRKQIEDALGLDVVSSYNRVKEAEAAVVSTAAERRAAEDAYSVRLQQWQEHATTSAYLYDAEADLTRARLNEITARADLRIARATLKKATGEA